MEKEYKIKKTSELIKELKPYVDRYLALQDEYYSRLDKINSEMQVVLKIEGIEIQEFGDNYGWGIGNTNRTMELIHDSELIEGKILDLYETN